MKKVAMGNSKTYLLVLLLSTSVLTWCAAESTNIDAHQWDTSLQLNDDVLGLIVFKSDLNNPPALKSWNEDDNSPCSWNFVRCDPVSGRVTELSLDNLGLPGKLGRGLEKLQSLKVLSLSHNKLTGNIDTELLSNIPSLERLFLDNNKFSGQIPNLISSLTYLDLSQNLLSGPIPESFFENCSSLRYLSLSGNSLEGQVHSEVLSRCTSLNALNLSSNHFSSISFTSPSGIWSLKRLRVLDLSSNKFSGSVPVGILSLHNLKQLHLQGNQFTGLIPIDIGLCPHLNHLDLSNNLFSGKLPYLIRRLTSLTLLNLSNNKLSDEFPQWLVNVTSLRHVDLSSNDLSGTLPRSIGSLVSLEYLSLSGNKLSGSIPASLVYCTQLSVLHLRDNKLSGSIPQGLFSIGLTELDLSHNELSGLIPPASSRVLESLVILDLSSNELRGEIPPEMGLFSSLKYLNLSWNNELHSRIPPELGFVNNLTVVDIRESSLYGEIPGDLCESGSLAILQLDGNSLTGAIPEEIGNCSSLYMLSLSHNKLSGLIPRSISMLKSLEILRLEYNKLSGEIPQDLGMLPALLAVNVSYNKLTGRLPTRGIFPSLDATAIQGNPGICSPLLKGPCKMNVPKPLVLDPYAYPHDQTHQEDGDDDDRKGGGNNIFNSHHKFLSVTAILAISAAAVIMAGVLVVVFLNASAAARRRRPTSINSGVESMCSTSSRSGSAASIGKLILFDSKRSSLSAADETRCSEPESLFNKASEIGGGAFGTVYKASLGGKEDEERIVAIKKLAIMSNNMLQHPEDFDREVRILGKIRHPNIVSLKGYYWTPQVQLLVSDFVTNGSLQSKIHDTSTSGSGSTLSWSTRFKIMLGTAKGLAHLHHSCNPPIIHYNLKPSNVLLDDNYNAKISDFGLPRLLLTKLDKHMVNNKSFQSALGYLAPELACQSYRINEKCDVYGYGVMVMELVTGRRPVEYGEENVMILNDHVRFLFEEGNVLDCVDEKLMGEYPEDEVLPVLKLALVCTSQVPSSRPSMAEVVQILQVIKTPLPPQRMELAY